MPTVLVVDDEPQILKLLSLMLRKEYTVMTAESGIEALVTYESYSDRIDLVITDITMPGMSGWNWWRDWKSSISISCWSFLSPAHPPRLLSRRE